MVQHSYIKFVLFILALVIIFFTVQRFGVFNQENTLIWQDGIRSLGWLAPIGFLLLYCIGTMLYLPGTIFTVIGGAVFGIFWGSILSIAGATIGAVGAYWVARLFGGEAVQSFTQKRMPRINTYNEQIKENGFLTVLILRITPLIPFNGLNLALAYSPVRLKDYTLATTIGITPGIVAYVYFGEAVASLSATNLIFAIAGIALYMALTALLAKRITQLRKEQNSDDSSRN